MLAAQHEEDHGQCQPFARVCCRLEWAQREEDLPKSGAQLQGAENGAAYACAKGMDAVGEKKITTYAAADRAALLRLLLCNCSRSKPCWPLLLLPNVFSPLIYIHAAVHLQPLPTNNIANRTTICPL
jgi:hypothetical protein